MKKKGMKFDGGGKLRYDLIPHESLRQVAAVLTLGACKYDENNWQQVKGGKKRYLAALMRHIEDHRGGEFLDEIGTPHLANVVCNGLFLLWLHRKKCPQSWPFAETAAKYKKQREAALKKGGTG